MKTLFDLETFLKRYQARTLRLGYDKGKFAVFHMESMAESSTLAGALENLLIEMQTAKAKEPEAKTVTVKVNGATAAASMPKAPVTINYAPAPQPAVQYRRNNPAGYLLCPTCGGEATSGVGWSPTNWDMSCHGSNHTWKTSLLVGDKVNFAGKGGTYKFCTWDGAKWVYTP